MNAAQTTDRFEVGAPLLQHIRDVLRAEFPTALFDVIPFYGPLTDGEAVAVALAAAPADLTRLAPLFAYQIAAAAAWRHNGFDPAGPEQSAVLANFAAILREQHHEPPAGRDRLGTCYWLNVVPAAHR